VIILLIARSEPKDPFYVSSCFVNQIIKVKRFTFNMACLVAACDAGLYHITTSDKMDKK